MSTTSKKWYQKYETLFVVGLVLVYAGLVLASINRSSVWHDEGYTAVLIENNFSGIVERTAMDVHPPLYYIALKAWSLVLGDGVMTLRLFSATCMLGAILIIWRIVRQKYGARAGLAALAAMSIGPFLVRYGQEMRMYGLAALLASLATYVYLKLIEKKRPLWLYGLYGVIVAAGMYTQYFFVLVPAVHFLHLLLFSEKATVRQRIVRLKPFIISGAIFILLFAAWLPTVKTQFTEVHGSFWIPKVSIETLTSTPIAMMVLKKQFQMAGYHGLVALIALLLLGALVRYFITSYKDKTARLLLVSILVPPFLLFLLSLPPFQPSYQDRYMSFMAPIFYSVLGLSIVVIRTRWIKYGAIVATVAVLGYGQFNNYREGNSHGWMPSPHFTMNSIIDQVNTDDPIYSTSLWTFFDAHATVKDRGMLNSTQIIMEAYPGRWMGNGSAIYDRPELITLTIPDDTKGLWLIDESGVTQYRGGELDEFTAGESYSSGYAKITYYTKQ